MFDQSIVFGLCLFALVSVVQVLPPRSFAQDVQSHVAAGTGDETDEAEQRKKWFAFYDKQAASYQLAFADQPEEKLLLKPTPISSYSNPVRTGQQHGSVYVWTRDGRPQAISSIWSSVPQHSPGKRSVAHEFQSLSSRRLISSHARQIGRKGVVPDWKPLSGGIAFKKIADAPTPAAKETSRLVQMRQLSRQFSASIMASSAEVDRNLRLQTQPVFRYTSESAGVIDGAIFLFVMGTDPEVVLLIEAFEDEGGVASWHYAAARLTNSSLRVNYRDQKIWECGAAEPYVGWQPYFIYWGVSMHDPKL